MSGLRWRGDNGKRTTFAEGFTLIEAIIFMLILGIIAMSALPYLHSGLEDSKLSGAASEVTVALEYAQLAAMTTGKQTSVTIDDAADAVLVERYKINGDILSGASEMSQSDVESGSTVPVSHPTKRGEDYNIVFANEDRLNGVDIVSAVFGAGNSVTFDATGGPSNGGTVTLALGSRQVTVTVDSLSGRVTSSD